MTNDQTQDGAAMNAERLERLAAFYRSVARGTIKPHTDEYAAKEALAHNVIRMLVEEWV